MFVPDRNLKDLVVSYVRKEERSISSLAKDLQKDGYKFHRLFITGYLKALADMGVLKEKQIPPAKVYTTASHREPNLYEAVGERCRVHERDEARQARLAVLVLERIFRRPVFLRELRECGFDGAVDADLASRDDRDDARKAFSKMGLPIPANEPAYVAADRRHEVRDAILVELLVEKWRVDAMVLDTRQTKLVER